MIHEHYSCFFERSVNEICTFYVFQGWNFHFLCSWWTKISFCAIHGWKSCFLHNSWRKLVFCRIHGWNSHFLCSLWTKFIFFAQSLDKIYIFIEICNVCVVFSQNKFFMWSLLKCTFFRNFLLKFMFYSRFLMKLAFFHTILWGIL